MFTKVLINWKIRKKALVTIRRNGLDKFEGQSELFTGWFKIDSALKNIIFYN